MIQTVEFDDYAAARVGREGRLPLSGSLELTAGCNLHCLHCYMRPYRSAPELATAEVLRLLDELADAGCLRLLLTGGEPLTRPDFRTVWRHAKSRGLLLTLFTNATLVDADTAAFLRDLPPTMCEVTLYGASPETYARTCGDAGAYRAALAGLDRLLAAVPHVGAKGMALHANGDDMPALEALCAERGIDFSFDTDIFPRLDGDSAPLAHAYDPDEGVRRALGSRLHRQVWGRMAQEWQAQAEAAGESRRDARTTMPALEESRRDARTTMSALEESRRDACTTVAGDCRAGVSPVSEDCGAGVSPVSEDCGAGVSPASEDCGAGVSPASLKRSATAVTTPPARPLKREGKVVVCRAGESSFHIGPYGDLCLCMLLREPHYDLRRGPFLEGWHTVIADLLQRERSTPAHCAQCPDLPYCVPCAGRNHLETGSVEEAAPLLCRRSRAVRQAFGGPLRPAASVLEEREVCHV